MVVAVTGANGQLGLSLQSISNKHHDIQFHFYDSALLNVIDKTSITRIFDVIRPNFCINTAAYTAVDKAESESEKAKQINVTGAKNLAEVCRDFNVALIHISTDFVFDGTKGSPYQEIDQTNPQSVYGNTKREGEIAIQQVLKQHFIIRTSWLYSQFGSNFKKTILRLATEKKVIQIVNDQIGTPTNAIDLAEVLIKIIQSHSSNYGIYHFSNEGTASWYDFAKKIVEVNKVGVIVKPIPTSQYPTPAVRPKYSVLDKTKLKNEFGVSILNWENSLEID